MPHPKLFTLSLLVLLATTGSDAAGQTIPSPYKFIENSQEWAIFAGKTSTDPGRLGLGPQDGDLLGGRYAVAFGSVMALDINATWLMSERDVLDVSRPEDDRLLGRSDIDLVVMDLRLRLNVTGQRSWHGIQPFIAFGGGVAYSSSTDRTLELVVDMPDDEWYAFGTRFAASLVLGSHFHVSEKISLRLEGLMNLWKIQTPVGWQTVEVDPLGDNPKSEWVSAYSLVLGAAWRF